jgi:hypothetical protein
MTPNQKSEVERTPERCRQRLTRAFQRRSMTAAVKSKCLECSGWSLKEAVECQIDRCPLWAYRPGTVTPPRIDAGSEQDQIRQAKRAESGRRLAQARAAKKGAGNATSG